MRVPFLTPLQALRAPVQGFDALRVLAQILALQSLHYLILSLLLPITLSLLAAPAPLTFQGGPANLSPLLDWRELLGSPTFSPSSDWADVWLASNFNHPSSDTYPTPQGPFQHVNVEDVTRPVPGMSLKDSQKSQAPPRDGEWDLRGKDEGRKYAIWLAWIIAAVADIHLLLLLIRRPTHILDHVLTFHALHLVLTTIFTGRIPSMLYYALAAAHAAVCTLTSEAMAVKRELRDGFAPVSTTDVEDHEREAMLFEAPAEVGDKTDEIEMERVR